MIFWKKKGASDIENVSLREDRLPVFHRTIQLPSSLKVVESKRDLKKPTVGFEPTTPGLQNQSSTVELRWHKYH